MRGILLSQMDSPPGLEREFHDWYDNEHIPLRLAIPGFRAASRYENVGGGPRWMVVYEIDDLSALQHPAYQRLKTAPSKQTREMLASVTGFTRFICEQTSEHGVDGDHGFVGVEAFSVEVDNPDRFEGGRQDQSDGVVADPKPLLVRSYRVREGDGGPWTRFVLHELAESMLWSPDRSEAAWLYRCRSRQERGSSSSTNH
jgi:hypothetical protein